MLERAGNDDVKAGDARQARLTNLRRATPGSLLLMIGICLFSPHMSAADVMSSSAAAIPNACALSAAQQAIELRRLLPEISPSILRSDVARTFARPNTSGVAASHCAVPPTLSSLTDALTWLANNVATLTTVDTADFREHVEFHSVGCKGTFEIFTDFLPNGPAAIRTIMLDLANIDGQDLKVIHPYLGFLDLRLVGSPALFAEAVSGGELYKADGKTPIDRSGTTIAEAIPVIDANGGSRLIGPLNRAARLCGSSEIRHELTH